MKDFSHSSDITSIDDNESDSESVSETSPPAYYETFNLAEEKKKILRAKLNPLQQRLYFFFEEPVGRLVGGLMTADTFRGALLLLAFVPLHFHHGSAVLPGISAGSIEEFKQ